MSMSMSMLMLMLISIPQLSTEGVRLHLTWPAQLQGWLSEPGHRGGGLQLQPLLCPYGSSKPPNQPAAPYYLTAPEQVSNLFHREAKQEQ